MEQRVDRIALINLEGDLEVVSPDGAEHRRLSGGERVFHFPAWAPDGGRIAAIGGNRLRAGVFVFPDAAHGLRMNDEHAVYESTRNAPIYLYWSPNGDHISFLAARVDEHSMGLHVVDADAPSEQTPAPLVTGRPCFWDWTPDGRRILIHVGGWDSGRGAQLTMVDPFAPNGAARTSVARPGMFQSPGIACSGRYRAFGHLTRRNEMQLVIDPVVDEVAGVDRRTRIAVRHTGVAAMTWSPTNDELAFISPLEPMRTYYGPLRLMNVEGEDVRVLTDDVVLAFFWSPDGRKIAYFTVAQAAEAIRMLMPDVVEAARAGGHLALHDIDEVTEEEIAAAIDEVASEEEDMIGAEVDDDAPYEGASDDDDADDADEPDLWLNLWVVDVQSGEQTLVSTFEPADLFVNQFLPFFDQYAKSHRIWSPDSDAIVLPVMRRLPGGGKMPRICVAPIDPLRGRLSEIADGIMAFWSPC